MVEIIFHNIILWKTVEVTVSHAKKIVRLMVFIKKLNTNRTLAFLIFIARNLKLAVRALPT